MAANLDKQAGSMVASNGDAGMGDALKTATGNTGATNASGTGSTSPAATNGTGNAAGNDYVPESPEEYVAMVYAKGDTATADEIASAQLILENLGGEGSALQYKVDGKTVDGVDGILGGKTTAAMERFIRGESPGQQATPGNDAVSGNLTGAKSDKSKYFNQTIDALQNKDGVKFGTKNNSDVRKLQKELGIKADGHFGNKTQVALNTYNRRVEFTDADGNIRLDRLQANQEFQDYASTIAGESIGQGDNSWKMVANVIMNRTHNSRDGWLGATTPFEVLNSGGFDAYDDPNSAYENAANYFSGASSTSPGIMNRLVDSVAPIYLGLEPDNTGGSVLYYSPETQSKLYDAPPSWSASTKLEEMSIEGIRSNDFRVFRYK
ncbi:MAG: cell wall hydrolase [Gammaproteobacteria bacterium]|nr:cell wall hydrolase [Gammaproteobacteria bacterium]